jgi:hypothetical protein
LYKRQYRRRDAPRGALDAASADVEDGPGRPGPPATGSFTPLLLSLSLPRINVHTTSAIIDTIQPAEGTLIGLGAKFMDVTVDLSDLVQHDCPPVCHYRIVLRDRAWLRRLSVAEGDEPQVGATLALFSTEPDEPLDGPAAREARIAIAAILPPTTWGNEPG